MIQAIHCGQGTFLVNRLGWCAHANIHAILEGSQYSGQ